MTQDDAENVKGYFRFKITLDLNTVVLIYSIKRTGYWNAYPNLSGFIDSEFVNCIGYT